MKILQIIPELNKGGAERLVLTICQELNKRPEHEVLLVTFRSTNAYPFLTEGLNWKVIPATFVPSLRGKSQKDLDELQTFVNDFQPDIIHTHLFEAEMVVSQLNYPKARYFTHFHDNMHQLRKFSPVNVLKKKTWADFLERRIMLHAYAHRNTQAITIAQDSFNYAKQVLPESMAVHLLHNAIDLWRFRPDETIQKEKSTVMIGSLVQNKGQELAIRSIGTLRRQGIELDMYLLGDGPLRQELGVLAIEEQVADLIHFEGNTDYPEKYLQKSLFYLHTSHKEAFGLVLIEAMACGLPVICTDGKGNRDLVQEGENGFMVIQRKPELLAEKMRLLLEQKDTRDKMSDNAMHIAQNYGIKNYVDTLLKLYEA